MDEESINLELEQLPWFIELAGKNEWSLSLLLKAKTRSLKCIGRYQ